MTTLQPTAATRLAQLEWRWKTFAQLTSVEVYEMLAARSAVFVVEQNCVYGDIDGLDMQAWHLLAYGSGDDARRRRWPAICVCCCRMPRTPTCALGAC